MTARRFGRSQRRTVYDRDHRGVRGRGRCRWIDDRRAVIAVARERKICSRFVAVYKNEIDFSNDAIAIEDSENFERTAGVSPSIVNVCDARNDEVPEVNLITACKVRNFRMKIGWIT